MTDPTRVLKGLAPTRGTHTQWLAAETAGKIVPSGVICITTDRIFSGSIELFIGDGASGYSSLEKFANDEFMSVPDNIIGIELAGTGNGVGRWRRINKYGQVVIPQPGFFATHPTYASITNSVVDDQRMVNIPKFYFLHKVVDGKHRWWIAPESFTIDGSAAQVHKGFIYNGVTQNSFQVGAYECSADGATKAASVGNASPLVSINFTTMVERCAARNAGDVTGFALWNVYQMSAIQMLCLIEMGSPDSQNIIGSGNSMYGNGTTAMNTGTTNAEWRGIHELWGNVWHMVQGLENRSGTYYIWGDAGNTTFSSMGISVPASGYPTAFSSDAADAGLFLPTSTGGVTDDITADYFYSNNAQTDVLYQGGSFYDGAYVGVFFLNLNNLASHSGVRIGGRLARVG